MPRIHVCPLSKIEATVAASGASHLISLINDDTPVMRPAAIMAENHLFLGINDIVEPMEGLVAPAEEHVSELIDFVAIWDRSRPMVVHCYAGISRSTAAAFITLCALKPSRDEREIATRLRSASPFAFPNPRLIGFADRLLKRDGRMIAAVQSIGRGEIAFESIPFALAVEG
jgi:predicted protein tyrosine phosphatase